MEALPLLILKEVEQKDSLDFLKQSMYFIIKKKKKKKSLFVTFYLYFSFTSPFMFSTPNYTNCILLCTSTVCKRISYKIVKQRPEKKKLNHLFFLCEKYRSASQSLEQEAETKSEVNGVVPVITALTEEEEVEYYKKTKNFLRVKSKVHSLILSKKNFD